ncbi:MAG: IS3 family transposase [Candidatus Brocadiaceae bacterium]|nr:IS3 family transposase [Candidatus Brocadiaceae bacterium]
MRDSIVDFVKEISTKSGFPRTQIIQWLELNRSRYYDWKKRYGKSNKHNSLTPRASWATLDEKQAVLQYYFENPLEGYRRLSYMMIDDDIVALSPSTVYRTLKDAGVIGKSANKKSKKGTGFNQPSAPHKHWHIDICYININGTFYYMFTIIDGFSRFIPHWEIHDSMTEKQIEVILERAKEMFPGITPRIISDNGPQFISKDFKEYIRLSGMTHVRTTPYYPQSNGKVERVQKTIKQETIRKKAPESVEEARKDVKEYIDHYNYERLHSAIGYIAPIDMLNGKAKVIKDERDKKLKAAKAKRMEYNSLRDAA